VDRKYRRGLQLLGIFFALCAGAYALDPSLQIRQYAHKSWKVREGFFRGSIYSITQTPDGYLWLGTEFGLVRFDGVKAVTWQPPVDQAFAAGRIVKLLTARDGTLWIGAETGLASLKDGKLTQYPELSQQRVSSLVEDRQGTVWAGSIGVPTGKFCSIQNHRARCFDEEAMVEGGVVGFYEDKQDRLWVAVPSGLWQWKPGPPKFYPIPDQPSGVRPVGEDEDGSLLINRLNRMVVRFVDGRIKSSPLQHAIPDDHVWPLLRDRDGGLWVPTSTHGLVHAHRGRVDMFDESEGLSGDAIRDLFEDDEGNIWVATLDGLDQFRDVAVPTFTVKQGLLNPVVWSVLAPRDGGLWLGSTLGLGRWHEGRITRFGTQGGLINGAGPHSLFEDRRGRIWVSTNREFGYLQGDRFVPMSGVPSGYVRAIAEDRAGDLWLINEQHGLIRLRGKTVEQITWAALGRKDVATSIVADPRQGGIWLGFLRGDIAYFSGGGLQATYSAKDGLGPGDVLSMRLDAHGALWVATAGGLSRFRNGAFATLSSQNGLPCDRVHWSMEDADQILWLYTACGLVRIARSEMDLWAAAVEKNEDSKIRVKVTVLDNFDGVRSNLVFHGLTPRVAKTSDGRLWFLPPDGLSVIDPHRLPVNKLPPPVHIEQITADEKRYDANNGMRLHPHVRNLAIDYTALSLVAPEKVRFRYKLDGVDKEWRDVVNDRQVQYTNLAPGTYRFRVLACNNSGVWNEEGAALEFVIPPMWYQTNWFYALCAAAFMLLLWAAYQLRVRQLAHEFNVRLEERVSERTRIARDLHDTLLQSFQGLLLRFQATINLLPGRPVEARKLLEDAVEHASQAITEGRDAITGLRMSTVEKNDLAAAIETVGEEIAAAQENPAHLHLLVEGTSRELHPILRDEVYRLATEALRNAFRHAAANNIEVEIRYDARYFRMRVRDDGKGMESEVLRAGGRQGHYGLHGMRERAKLVGGKLTIWTEVDSGTEIEIVIPGAKAYATSTRPFWSFGRRAAAEADEKETIERE
jgi:signal transduction histidine kinase/ligand-binding sensor domain-containing protein